MKKSEYKFYRDKKESIERDSKTNEPIYFRSYPQPIFIPKRKKRK